MKLKSLDIVRHVYGEEAGAPLDELIERDDALHDEYVALREVRALMDARPRHQPAPETVQKVLDAAARQAKANSDRSAVIPLARLRPSLRLARWTRPLSYASAACFLLLAGYWFGSQNADSPGDLLKSESLASERLQETRSPGPVGLSYEGEALSVADVMEKSRVMNTDDMLTWEDTEDLFLIQWRIGSLEENIAGSSWDRAVPLGSLESGETTADQRATVQDTAVRWIYR